MTFEKKKILVVDDSMTNLILLNGLLDEEGYEVLSTISAKQGLKIIETDKPDLVLLDLKMPDISGYDFLKMLYADKSNKTIPVIAVTAIQEEESIKESYKLGVMDVILKPIQIDQLVTKIKNVFKA